MDRAETDNVAKETDDDERKPIKQSVKKPRPWNSLIEAIRLNCVTKWTVLVMACIQNLGGMSPMAIGTTAQDMKNSFNMTQEEYGIATSIYFVAELNTLPVGPLLDRFGPTGVSVMSVVLTVLPHAGLAVLANHEPFDHNELLIYFLFLLGGMGLAANNAVIFWTCMANFPNGQHGRIVGIINGSGFLGAMFFNIIYTKAFTPNLSGYFVMLSLLTGITFNLGVIFNVKVETMSIYEPIEFMEVKEDPKGKIELFGVNDGPMRPFWKSIQPYNLFLLSGIGYGVVNAQLLWFSSQVESTGFTQYMALVLSISPLVSAVGLVAVGFLSDHLVDHIPRMGIQCVLNIMMATVVFFSIFYLDSLAMLIALTFANGCMVAGLNCLILAELHKEYGEQAFGTTMGIFYLTGTTFIFICQYVASVLYDKELKRQGSPDNICYGHNCFDDYAIIQTCLLTLCVVLNVCYICRGKCINGR